MSVYATRPRLLNSYDRARSTRLLVKTTSSARVAHFDASSKLVN